MIVCTKCGHENGNNDTFCQNPDCNAFLEWGAEAVPIGLAPKVVPGEPADGAGADSGESTQPFDTAAEARRDDPEPARPADDQAGRLVARAAQPRPDAAPGPTAPRPSAPPPPAPSQPSAQKPAEPPRPVVAEPPRPPAPSQPSAQKPAESPHPVGPTIEPGRAPAPQPRQLAAGERPAGHSERGQALRRLGAVLAIFVVLAAAMIAASRLLRPDRQGGGSVTTTSRPAEAKTFTLVSAAKVKVEASSESGSRKATLLLDGNLGTFWSRDPIDQFATFSFSFAEPVQLGRIAIAAGAAGAEFKLRHRPKTLEFTFSDGSTLTKTLTDRPQLQNIDFPPRSVERVTMKIADVFQAPNTGSNYRRTSISEVRFFSAT